MKKLSLLQLVAVSLYLTSCSPKYSESKQTEGYTIVKNQDGATLGYGPAGKILVDKGYAFKDLNRNGSLDNYEDWRLSVDERATDLASKLSLEQIAGLMLYSSHQFVPGDQRGFRGEQQYGGKPYSESGANPYDLSDDQMKFLKDDNLRHVLIVGVQSPVIAAKWNNKVQAYVEGFGMGIPVNTSSDPRHGSDSYAEFNAGAGGDISMWPGTLGIAATFDPNVMRQFGEIASQEYRALGIGTALSPQIDLATTWFDIQ